MKIIPAIDLRGGRIVRLLRGDPAAETEYGDDPAAAAKSFFRQGADRLHVVNLDGAFGENDSLSRGAIKKIRKAFPGKIEVGGGIRDWASAKKYIDEGMDWVILGSVYFDDIQEFGQIVSAFPERVIMSADVRADTVRIHGWKKDSRLPIEVFMKNLSMRNISVCIVTEIEKDGALSGLDGGFYAGLIRKTEGISIIASGGVSSEKDLDALEESGVYGVVVGKAIYDMKIDLGEAVKKYGGS